MTRQLVVSLSLHLSLHLVIGDDEDLSLVGKYDSGDEKVGNDDDDSTGEMSVWSSILPNISSVRASIYGIMCIVSSLLLLRR